MRQFAPFSFVSQTARIRVDAEIGDRYSPIEPSQIIKFGVP